jgi:hypothetical protein
LAPPAGLLRLQQGGGALAGGLTGRTGGFGALRRALRLVVPDGDQMERPTDISHLYKVVIPKTHGTPVTRHPPPVTRTIASPDSIRTGTC